ncbi:hypothetical protein CTRI78_v003074 [Colletotrichum trifolii]|uniref:Uncharacterized protein n=1 Tax=Colletotrichum trifolii TaxID=5466 RepID=A0A4R8RWF4_COLTR|nr:hypothetical protein CTRI78_v003074 [Colletotrichum trifolii]
MGKRQAATKKLQVPKRVDQPSDQQEQSPFFRLPQDVRKRIYHLAYPRINSPQLVFVEVDGKPSFHEIGTVPAAGHRLFRVVRNTIVEDDDYIHPSIDSLQLVYADVEGTLPLRETFDGVAAEDRHCRTVRNIVFEDDGSEIRARRMASTSGKLSVREKGGNPHRGSLPGLGFPLSLLLACRRMYEDVAPLCDQSLAFQDFFSLELFLNKVSDGVLKEGLLDRLKNICLDIKFNTDGVFKPSAKKKIVASCAAACKRLAGLKKLQVFNLRLEVPVSSNGHVPGNIQIPVLQELNSVAATCPEVEVLMVLMGKWQTARLYKPGKAGRRWDGGNFDVPGWEYKFVIK